MPWEVRFSWNVIPYSSPAFVRSRAWTKVPARTLTAHTHTAVFCIRTKMVSTLNNWKDTLLEVFEYYWSWSLRGTFPKDAITRKSLSMSLRLNIDWKYCYTVSLLFLSPLLSHIILALYLFLYLSTYIHIYIYCPLYISWLLLYTYFRVGMMKS